MMYLFACKCGLVSKWLVWYKDCGGLYNYRCDKCVCADIEGRTPGTSAHPVVCVRSIRDVYPTLKMGEPPSESEI